MKIQERTNCFETNSSSAHTVTYKPPAADFKYPGFICIDKARFDYCGDTVKGYQDKANYLWEIIMQNSSNSKWIMKFITYLTKNNIQVYFEQDWFDNGDTWIDNELPYDSEGQQLLMDYLDCQSSLIEFLFNDDLVVELYEG